MRRSQLEAVLRALARVSGEREVVLVGSQCVHAVTDVPPAEVLMSAECDVLIDEGPLSDRVDAELGPTSRYQQEHGVYVDTVPAGFPFLPAGFAERLLVIDVGVLRARCLEPHDLAVSKLAAGRLKDHEMVAALIASGLTSPDTLHQRVAGVEDLRMRAILLARLQIVVESMGG
jgi:hypothetical protein